MTLGDYMMALKRRLAAHADREAEKRAEAEAAKAKAQEASAEYVARLVPRWE